jgi:hypothetical protein
MLFKGKALRAKTVCTAALALLAAMPAWVSATPTDSQPVHSPDVLVSMSGAGNSADTALVPASADARYALRWIMNARDNQGLPFVVVDKKGGRIFVFEANGQLRGASPALTGLTAW